jgi:hypothetical protein
MIAHGPTIAPNRAMSPTPHATDAGERRTRSLVAPIAAVALGVAILALPASLEGPPLIVIGEGHALSAVDALGVLPLATGATWLQVELWRRRDRLTRWLARRPSLGVATIFGAGLGLGLLLASAFSRVFWWWALGAVLLVCAVAIVLAGIRVRQ